MARYKGLNHLHSLAPGRVSSHMLQLCNLLGLRCRGLTNLSDFADVEKYGSTPDTALHFEPRSLSWSGICLTIQIGKLRQRHILQECAGEVNPGEMMAIVGPSGEIIHQVCVDYLWCACLSLQQFLGCVVNHVCMATVCEICMIDE